MEVDYFPLDRDSFGYELPMEGECCSWRVTLSSLVALEWEAA